MMQHRISSANLLSRTPRFSVLGMGSDFCAQLAGIGGPDPEDEATFPPTLIPVPEDIRIVCAGGLHSIALSSTGVPYTWGARENGALGRPTDDENETGNVQERTPTPVTGFVRQDGTQEDGEIIQIAGGDCHSLFLSKSGAVYQCGFYRSHDGTRFKDMEHLQGSVLGSNVLPVHVFQMPGKAVAIYASGSVNAAILLDGSLVTWGLGMSGALADGRYHEITATLDPVTVQDHFLVPKRVKWESNPSQKRKVISVGIGSNHIAVVARDHKQRKAYLYTSGSNAYGQLGHGDTGCAGTNRHALLVKVDALESENIVQVAAGEEFTLALTFDRSRLYSFGRADCGQLGTGRFEQSHAFHSNPQLVQFPETVSIMDINVGANHAMALTANHFYSWGCNGNGATGHPVADDADNFILQPTQLDLNSHVIGFSCGSYHSLVSVGGATRKKRKQAENTCDECNGSLELPEESGRKKRKRI